MRNPEIQQKYQNTVEEAIQSSIHQQETEVPNHSGKKLYLV